MSETRCYPRRVNTEVGEIEFDLMRRADEAAVLAFANALPVHDLLFLPRNISQPKVLSAWIHEIEGGDIVSLLARKGGAVVGCGTLVKDSHSWSPHVGEIRMVVSLEVRGKGVGRALSQETFALALSSGLEKLSAQMTVDQRAAIALFESLASRPRRCSATMSATPAGKSTISSCWGITWRRFGRSSRPMASRGRLRPPEQSLSGWLRRKIAHYS